MKRWTALILTLTTLALGSSAFANILAGKHRTVRFDKWGTFTIGVVPQIDNQPFILTLDLKCDADPKVQHRKFSKKVCEYRGYSRDDENQYLILHYSIYNDVADGRPEARRAELPGRAPREGGALRSVPGLCDRYQAGM